MITPVTHLVPLTYIRRARMLPDKGSVLVNLNQRVKSTDIVAESSQIGKHKILDVRKALDLWHHDEAEKLMKYKIGEKVEKGDILAQLDGFIPRVVRSPVEGKIVAIHRGQVTIEHSVEKYELSAGIPGTIAEILPDRGVVIESNGALIQGVWGNAQIAHGILNIIDQPVEEELTSAALDLSFRGTIVLGSYVTKPETFKAAQELLLRGLILSSMTSNLIPLAQKSSFPIILMEGFGQVPMNDAAFQLLLTNEKREISVNSEWDASRGEKPEIFIPLPAQGKPSQDYSELSSGKTVRITVPPYSGQAATLVTVKPGLFTLPNGKRTTVASVRLSNTQIVNIPIANLDVLE